MMTNVDTIPLTEAYCATCRCCAPEDQWLRVFRHIAGRRPGLDPIRIYRHRSCRALSYERIDRSEH